MLTQKTLTLEESNVQSKEEAVGTVRPPLRMGAQRYENLMECTKYVRTFQIIGNLLLNKVYFMARTKRLERDLAQVDYITKQEAMTLLDVPDEVFKEEWQPFLNLYDVGCRSPRYSKSQMYAFVEYRCSIKGRPFEEWNHKI